MPKDKKQIETIIERLLEAKAAMSAMAREKWSNVNLSNNEEVTYNSEMLKQWNEKQKEITDLTQEVIELAETWLGYDESDIKKEEDDVEQERKKWSGHLAYEVHPLASHDLTYTKPVQVEIEDRIHTNFNSWKACYVVLLNQLNKINSDTFRHLPEHHIFTTKQNKKYFSYKRNELRNGAKLDAGFYAETHFSANQLAKVILDVLDFLAIPEDWVRLEVVKIKDIDASMKS